MSSRIFSLALFLGLFLSPLAYSDTFILKDGTKLEGEIVSETDDAYEIRYQVAKGIKDNKTIPKDTIESIEKTSPADEAFAAISGLVPSADRLTLEDYDRMINEQVKAFLQAFGSSTHSKAAAEILATLEKERAVVAAGGVKLAGAWVSPSDREANAYEIDAQMTLEDATVAAEAGQFVTALRALDTMHADYRNTANYSKAVDLTQRVFKVYGAKVEADLGRVDMLIAAREKELSTLSATQRASALSEIAKKDAAYEALIQRDKKKRIKWPILNIYHKDPMADTLRAIDADTRRLENIDLDSITPAGPAYREAWSAAATGKEEDAKNRISELRNLRVPARYITALETKLTEALAPPPEPEAPTGEGSADGEPEGEAGEETEEPAESERSKPAEEAPSAAAADASAPPSSDDDEGEGGIGLSTILFGVIAVVLVVAVIAVFAGGGKKK